jgi:hypothetical protein
MKTSKRLLTILLLTALAVSYLGCATPEKTAYGVLGSVTVSVDTAMRVYGGLVRADLISEVDQSAVRTAYEDYQAAMQLVASAVTAYRSSSDGTQLDAALRLVETESGNLLLLIQRLTTRTPPPQPDNL